MRLLALVGCAGLVTGSSSKSGDKGDTSDRKGASDHSTEGSESKGFVSTQSYVYISSHDSKGIKEIARHENTETVGGEVKKDDKALEARKTPHGGKSIAGGIYSQESGKSVRMNGDDPRLIADGVADIKDFKKLGPLTSEGPAKLQFLGSEVGQPNLPMLPPRLEITDKEGGKEVHK